MMDIHDKKNDAIKYILENTIPDFHEGLYINKHKGGYVIYSPGDPIQLFADLESLNEEITFQGYSAYSKS